VFLGSQYCSKHPHGLFADRINFERRPDFLILSRWQAGIVLTIKGI
jgi:hypothetical protein